jgi:peptide/nickel transport system substrate-binding protein
MTVSRRGFMQLGVSAGVSGVLLRPRAAFAEQASNRGGTLIVGQSPEPLVLTSAASIDPGTLAVSGKVFDCLLTLDLSGRVVPQLATEARVAPGGGGVTLKLRPGVRWHDGKPFTSADVAFSVTNVWSKYNARSQAAFANLLAVDTPDPITAVLRFSKPAPYIFSTLTDVTSQIVPQHLYTGSDVLTNPYNLKPVGTGPFRFVSWERGSHILLERNPDYWAAPKPFLDRVFFRFLPDGAAMVAALETGAVHYISGSNAPYSEVNRLKSNPAIVVQDNGPISTPVIVGFGFNLDRPLLKDVRVRQALAHAIDRPFILKNIWLGYGTLSDSPIPPQYTDFYTDDVPKYGFQLDKAAALLDAAGYPRRSGGMRFSLTCDPKPPNAQVNKATQFVRATLARIGVGVDIRSQNLGEYIQRVFTRRDFDTILYTSGYDTDPALAIQRFYWSKSFEPGVPFSNPTHYGTPEVDRLLEAAQVENEPTKRKELYARVQRAVQRDLPIIPLLFPSGLAIYRRTVQGIARLRADNLADARIAPV